MADDPSGVTKPTPLQLRGQVIVDRLRGKVPAVAEPLHGMPRIGVALGGGSARGLTHIPYIEAMDAGTAIVTSPNAGAGEVLQNGRYGIIVSDDGFADNLLQLLEREDLRREFEARGLERAQEFSAEAIAERYLQIYRNVVR